MARLPAYFNCSLREVLLITAFLGVSLAALKTGGPLASLVQLLSLILVIGVSVTAIVEGGAAKAFAAGFLIALGAYAVLLYSQGEAEFDPAQGRLFATQAFEPLYDTVKQDRYYNVYNDYFADSPETRRELSNYSRVPVGTTDVSYSGMTDDDVIIQTQYKVYRFDEIPDRKGFMIVAHLLVAMALAYGSGKFAAALQRRKERRETDLSTARHEGEQPK
ncbi:MAG TPA: hypothetical protein VGN57_22270 [Pirellulaceae bacterium]|jgi:hypothetical protein|nr:hypothetical protein [Pirellulaceae bacterium]